MYHKKLLITAALSGITCVALGAMGAHAFKDVLKETLHTYEKAVLYQLMHTLALFALAPVYQHFPDKKFKIAGYFWAAGILLFSGSLYIYALTTGMGILSFKWLVHITPFGGMSFILGWVFILLGTLKMKN
jgi:uncharacterized membrane protein YgdD (TMEM256/DUF423 family)